MKLTSARAFVFPILALSFPCVWAIAETPATLTEGLDNPCGIAVQPVTGDVFVSCNKVVYRLVKKDDYKRTIAIEGFPEDIYGKGPKYNIGPLGLLFLDGDTLVVGGGGNVDGEEVVSFFSVGASPKPLAAKDALAVSGPIKGGEASAKGEGNFYALAAVGSDIFITLNGDDTKGWIGKIAVTGKKPGSLTPAIATKSKVEVDAPCGIVTNKKGQLVVSQMGEVNLPGDSLITIYDPKTGNLLKSMKTNVSDIINLAYSPKTGRLYGVDFSWVDPAKGSLLAIELTEDAVKTEKIADLMKPTAIAFDDEGNAFVTIFGDPSSGGGRVLLFKGL